MNELATKRVGIVGAGGLGCPASLVLARAGVGSLTLVDSDVVDPTNLHRQLWHTDADVGRAKVESASEKLRAQFPRVNVRAVRDRITERNVAVFFAEHDLVIDGTDGIEVKFLLSDAAVRTGVPLVHGGVLRLHGQAMLIAPGGPCLRCLFETPPSADDVPTCAQAGVLGSMAGVIGALEAELALAHLRTGGALEGVSRLQVFEGATFTARTVKVKRAADCEACGGRASTVVHAGLAPRRASCTP